MHAAISHRWSGIRARAETILPDLPPAEHVTDFSNVTIHFHKAVRVDYAVIRAALQPSDGESRRALRALRLDDGKLPEQAIATPIGLSPFRLGLEVNTTTEPTACEWEPTAVFFLRLYNAGNLCHLLNEALLPLLHLALPVSPPREIYYFGALRDPTAKHKPLPIFETVARQLGRVAPIHEFFNDLQKKGSRCVSHLTWGLGIKPFYNSFRVDELRRAAGSLRQLLLGRMRVPLPGAAPTTIFITRRAKRSRHTSHTGELALAQRSIPDLEPLRKQIAIDELCCDFSAPLQEQLTIISRASVLLGLHGAGLANVIFAREGAILIEFKGDYGLTDFVYRKYSQANFGGWAILHIEETNKAHYVTASQAAVARACLEHLQSGDAVGCRQLPYVMQASAVGHNWDCWFREWLPVGRLAHKSTWCPTPSFIAPYKLDDGRETCWAVHSLAHLLNGGNGRIIGRALSSVAPEAGLTRTQWESAMRQARMRANRFHKATGAASGGSPSPLPQLAITPGDLRPDREPCTDRHRTIEAALSECYREGRPKCNGVTRPGGRERQRDAKRCGNSFYVRRSGALVEYEGHYEGTRTWMPLTGADAKPCENMRRLRIAPEAVNGSSPPPLGGEQGELIPLRSGWDPSAVLLPTSRHEAELEELRARQHREVSVARMVAARGEEEKGVASR